MESDEVKLETALWVYGSEPPVSLRGMVRVWAKGDARSFGRLPFNNPGWCLGADAQANTVEQGIASILLALEPVAGDFQFRHESVRAEISCAVYQRSGESTAEIRLPYQLMADLSRLRISLDVDIYVVG